MVTEEKNLPNILIVDDEPNNIFLLSEYIDDLEVNVFSATSGPEALEIIASNDMALVLLDIQMPGMDGYQVIEKIREMSGKEHVPVIFISAIYTDKKYVIKGIESGAIDYIEKPIDQIILKGKINQYLNIHNKQKELDSLVNQLKRSNIRLQESEARFKKISYAANDSIIVIDEKYEITYWNQASKTIFGYSKPEAIYEPILDLIISEKSSIKFQELLNQIQKISDNSNHSAQEFIAKNKIGLEFPVEMSISGLKSPLNKQQFVLVIRDITHRKKMEKDALKAKELKESNKTMREFMDNVSHEMRTPMNAIIGISNMMLKYESDNLLEQQIEGLTIIRDNGQRLLDLINDVLDLSKLDANKLELKNEPFDTDKFLSSVKTMTINLIGKKNIRFIIRKSNKIPSTLILDNKKLNQILLNLLGNAAKFTDEGKITLSIHLINNFLHIEVEDTGMGIPQEAQKQIFKRFKQIDSSNSRQYQGTGLGLSITKKLVELMGGNIEIESTVNQGTIIKFKIKLPPENEPYLNNKQEKTKTAFPNNNVGFSNTVPLILIIDDSDYYSLLFKKTIEKIGFEAMFATEGIDGFNKLSYFLPELVILNLSIPKLSGYSILEKKFNLPILKDIPVILKTESNRVVQKKNYQYKSILIEPFNDNDIFKQINNLELQVNIPSMPFIILYNQDISNDFQFIPKMDKTNVFMNDNLENSLLILSRRKCENLILEGLDKGTANDGMLKQHNKLSQMGIKKIIVHTNTPFTSEQKEIIQSTPYIFPINSDLLAKCDPNNWQANIESEKQELMKIL